MDLQHSQMVQDIITTAALEMSPGLKQWAVVVVAALHEEVNAFSKPVGAHNSIILLAKHRGSGTMTGRAPVALADLS